MAKVYSSIYSGPDTPSYKPPPQCSPQDFKTFISFFVLLCLSLIFGLCSGSQVFCVAGGKTIRQCIRYTDCDVSRLTQMFPSISRFTYRCCNSNLCNSGSTAPAAGLVLVLLWSLLSLWWFWFWIAAAVLDINVNFISLVVFRLLRLLRSLL